MCCSSSLKKHKELGNVEEYRRRQVNSSRLFPFKIGKCPAPPSAQNWQKAVGPRYTIYCLERSGQKWSSWQTCSQNSISLTCKVSKCSAKNGRRCSGLMSENSKSLAIAEGRFVNRRATEPMSVCKKKWSIAKVPCRFGVAFLQMEL